MDKEDVDRMSPKDLAALRSRLSKSTTKFVIENVKRTPRPTDREIAEYVARELEMPVEVVEYVRDGMGRDLEKEEKAISDSQRKR